MSRQAFRRLPRPTATGPSCASGDRRTTARAAWPTALRGRRGAGPVRGWGARRSYRTLPAPSLRAHACLSRIVKMSTWLDDPEAGKVRGDLREAGLTDRLSRDAQVVDEAAVGHITVFAGGPQHRRRMHRRQHLTLPDRRRKDEYFSALLRHPKAGS